MLGFRSAFDSRDRLISLVQAHPNMARTDPLQPGQFPNNILSYDPGTVDQATDIDVAFVTPGQNIETFSLGPGGVGKLTLLGSILLLVYVYNTPVGGDPATPETFLAQKSSREALMGAMTNKLLEAVLSFPVDPTPGDQLWNIMHLAPTGLGLHTTYYSTEDFHQSKTRVNLFGQMYRPLMPSGTLSS